MLSDQHLYVRSGMINHYLVTTKECKYLLRSYRLGDRIRLNNYGRTVCQNDGSHIVYSTGSRVLPCPILTIQRVEDRATAKSMAEGDPPLVDIEAVEMPDIPATDDP